MTFVIDQDKPITIRPTPQSVFTRYNNVSEYDSENTITYKTLIQNNVFISVSNAIQSRNQNDGILVLCVITDATGFTDYIYIHWNWERFPSTALLATAGIPGTTYDDFIGWLQDYGYANDSEVVTSTITELQRLINIARIAAGLTVDPTDEVE